MHIDVRGRYVAFCCNAHILHRSLDRTTPKFADEGCGITHLVSTFGEYSVSQNSVIEGALPLPLTIFEIDDHSCLSSVE